MANIPSTLNGVRNFLDTQSRVIPEATDPGSFDAGNAEALFWRGRIYTRSTTTRAADNSGVIADRNGVKFVSNSLPAWPSAVTSRTNTPPTNPAIGDSWLIGNAPTGAWSSYANHIATWEDHGWSFADPDVGWIVEDLGASVNRQKQADGTWSQGFGADNFTVRSIRPSRLRSPGFLPIIGIRNAPPPVPLSGDNILVGTAGTGIFSGRSNQIAYYVGPNDDDFEFSGTVGDGRIVVFNREDSSMYVKRGGAWVKDGVDTPIIARHVVDPRVSDLTPAGFQARNRRRVIHTETISNLAAWIDIRFAGETSVEVSLGADSTTRGNFQTQIKLMIGGVDIATFPTTTWDSDIRTWANINSPRTITHRFDPSGFLFERMADYPSNRDVVIELSTVSSNVYIADVTDINLRAILTPNK